MIGDPLKLEKHQIPKSTDLSYMLAQLYSEQEKLLVGLCGPSGTSKSEISFQIQENLYSLEIPCFIISIDDWYKTDWSNRNQIRQETGKIGHQEINWRKLNKVTKNFKSLKSTHANIQVLNKYTDSLQHTRINTNKIGILLIEGIYAGYVRGLDILIYLDATYEDTYSFRKARGKENPDSSFRKQVLKIEEKEVKETKQLADIIISFNYE